MIDMLWGIAGGLERIHTEGKVHGREFTHQGMSKIKVLAHFTC